MSASEKLQALAEKGGNSGLSATWSDDARLYRALPQIVAVVEAAEQGPGRVIVSDKWNPTKDPDDWKPMYPELSDALAALKEALS